MSAIQTPEASSLASGYDSTGANGEGKVLAVPVEIIPLLELSIGCRYCHRELYDDQEVIWGICTGCHDDGVLEMRASA